MALLEDRFVEAKVEGIHIYSHYTPPSTILAKYEQILSVLVLDARRRWLKIIAGDFNA